MKKGPTISDKSALITNNAHKKIIYPLLHQQPLCKHNEI